MRSGAWKYRIAIVACLAGCGERPQAVGVPATPSTTRVWFDPAALEDCAPPQVGSIHWDASKSSAKTVDVKIVRSDGGENLFATDGPVGSQVTEPWMRPGLLVIVRDHATGAELGRKTVAEKPCSR